MDYRPVNDLNECSVKDCKRGISVIIQRKIGDSTMMYGYCPFHSIISATLFPSPARREIRV